MKKTRRLETKYMLLIVGTSFSIVCLFIAYKITISSIYQKEKISQFNNDIFKYLQDQKSSPTSNVPEVSPNIPEMSPKKPNNSHWAWISIITIILILGIITIWMYINPTNEWYKKTKTYFSNIKLPFIQKEENVTASSSSAAAVQIHQ